MRRFVPLVSFAFALLLPATVVLYAACGDLSHVYSGRLFAEDRGCVATTTSLDVVEGEPAAQCPPVCFAQPHADGGRSIYLATMCAPYPFLFDASGSDPSCAPALAALARGDTCLSDGGSRNPLPAPSSPDGGDGGP